MKLNVKQFPEIEAKLSAIEDFELEENKEYLDTHTGPAVGVVWNDSTLKLEIVDGWATDEYGDVVNIAKSTGPATGAVLVDGVVVYKK